MMMPARRPLLFRIVFAAVALVMVAALIMTGCSGSDSGRNPVAGLSDQRVMLSEGYSLLYADASKIDLVDLALFAKAESQEFNNVITEISKFGGELKQDLERIARDYPGVRIDLKPLPEMEVRKRFAVGKDRMITFAPLGGHSRLEYERTMLISLSNALNHESHLCQVMAAEEPDPGLKKFLLASEQRYGDLYQLAVSLLNREHFKYNTNAR
jgi:hypothetical protein